MYKGLELKTIKEVVRYWQEWVEHEQPGMPQDDFKNIIGHILHVEVSDHVDEWQQYPQFSQILDIAADLDVWEIYVDSPDALWRQLKNRLAILDATVNHEFRFDDTRERLSKFVIITQAVHYWAECLKRSEAKREIAQRMIDVAGNEHFLDEFYNGDKIFAEVFDILCDYATTGTSPWRPWRHVEQLVGLLQERWPE